MVLYRTDDFKHECSTKDIYSVLKYELITKENYDIFTSISKLLETPNKIGIYSISDFGNAHDKGNFSLLEGILLESLKLLNYKFNTNLRYAIWLYPKENVENYYAFEGFDAMIDGYATSDICLLDYPDEGALYAYVDSPRAVTRV